MWPGTPSPHVTSDVRNGWGRAVDSPGTVRIRSFGGERTCVPRRAGVGPGRMRAVPVGELRAERPFLGQGPW